MATTNPQATEGAPPLPTQEQVPEETAMELKVKANAAFQKGALDEAVALYTAGIAKCRESEGDNNRDLLGVLFSNRAIANFNAGAYQQSANDANAALEQRPKWVKAFHRKALAVAALGKFGEALELYTQALELEPDNKWLKEQEKLMKVQVENAPIKTEADWQYKYKHLSPMPMRMATLVHFWNISSKAERFAALSRLSELANYRFHMQEETMNELPLERYQEINIPEQWLTFFTALDTKRKVNVLEAMWNDSNMEEKRLIMFDLQFYFKSDALRGDAGNDSGDEVEVVEVENEAAPLPTADGGHGHSHSHGGHAHACHGHSHAHAHSHSHGQGEVDADGHVEGCPNHLPVAQEANDVAE